MARKATMPEPTTEEMVVKAPMPEPNSHKKKRLKKMTIKKYTKNKLVKKAKKPKEVIESTIEGEAQSKNLQDAQARP